MQEVELEGFVNCGVMLQSGVYAIVPSGNVVYVGKAKVMLGRVYSHRVAWGKKRPPEGRKPEKGILFDAIWVRPCEPAKLDELEYAMINLYKPRYNTLLKNDLPIPLDIAEVLAPLLGVRSLPPPRSAVSIQRRV